MKNLLESNPCLLLPSCYLTRTAPADGSEEVVNMVEHELLTRCEEVFEYHLSNAGVWAFPILEWKGRKVWDPRSGQIRINPRGPFSLRRWLGALRYPVARASRALLFITHHSAFSVYHWLCEAIPRLILLADKYGWDSPAILTEETSSIRSFQERSLFWLGFSGPLIRTSFYRGLKVKHLITCDLLAPIGHHRPEFIRLVRNRIRQHFEREITEPKELVYISRSKARCRRTVNESDVTNLLRAYGFRIVHLEVLSPDDQVRSTLNAKLIVGNHGGGLPALVYAPQNCRLLEIRSKTDKQNNCYYTLAHALGNEYHLLPVEPSQPERGLDTDYNVDIEALKYKLDKILAFSS